MNISLNNCIAAVDQCTMVIIVDMNIYDVYQYRQFYVISTHCVVSQFLLQVIF